MGYVSGITYIVQIFFKMLSIFGVSIVLYYIVQMYHIKFPQCSLPIHSADEAGGGGEALFGGGGVGA